MIPTHDVVLEALSAQMHVRKEAEQQRIVRKRSVHFNAVIVGVGRNRHWIVIVR